MSAERAQTRAIVALLCVTVIWGWTFTWMKAALNAAELTLGPGSAIVSIGVFLTLRFGVAALVLPLVSRSARRGLADRGNLADGAVLAAIIFSGFALQMFGLTEVSPAVSAFLTSTYVVFTALISVGMGRERLGRVLVFGVGLVTVGASLISGPPQVSFGLGEWLTVASAVVFAVHIVATDRITRRRDPMVISTISFALVAGSSALVAAVGGADAATWEALLSNRAFVVNVGYCAVLGTLCALVMLNLFQRALSPVRAAILYTLEPVWAALIALVAGLQPVDGWLVGGCALLLVGNLIAEFGQRSGAATAPELAAIDGEGDRAADR
jgi:drug/metabolite transporter (DMT)-like permease